MKRYEFRGIRLVASLFAMLCVLFAATVLSSAAAPTTAAPTASEPAASVEAAVLEVPDVRIVIDGEYDEYAAVPLNINGRVLLPFREILANLGVADDDEHIIWNEGEQSVTVKTDDSEIRLVIGNPVMLLDGEELTFDAAPYIHAGNGRTYVPVRAVSELMDKLVMWVDGTRTVYVRDKTNFSDTVAVLEELQKVESGETESLAADVEGDIRIDMSSDGMDIPGADEDGVMSTNIDMTMRIEAEDAQNVYMNQSVTTMGIPVNVETYIVDGIAVSKVGGIAGLVGEGWEKTPGTGGADYNSLIEQAGLLESQFGKRPVEDIAMAVSSETQSDGTYTLVGEILDIDLINEMTGSLLGSAQLSSPGMGVGMEVSNVYFSQTLDSGYKTTDMTVFMNMDMTMLQDAGNGNQVEIKMGIYAEMVITPDNDFPQDYTLNVPADAQAAILS